MCVGVHLLVGQQTCKSLGIMPSILDNGSTQESTDPVLLFSNSTAMYVIGQNSKLNKIYREKSIPMTALWCPAFSYHG